MSVNPKKSHGNNNRIKPVSEINQAKKSSPASRRYQSSVDGDAISLLTERQQAEELLKQLYEVIPSAIFTVDINRIITSFSRKAEEITGYAAAEVIGKSCSILAFNICHQRCGLYEFDPATPLSGKECIIKRKDREERIVSRTAALLRDINGNVTGGIESFEDITDRRNEQGVLNYLAYYDSLTGLPNRLLFHDRFSISVAHSYRNKSMLAIIFLDLDNFKAINDTLGHTVGDLLLQEVANRLKRNRRAGDTVARLGGDEFTLLLPQIGNVEDAAKVAQKVIEALKSPFKFENCEFRITASAGIAIFPDDGKDVTTLLKSADIALYRAKERGRNNYQLYSSAMGNRAFLSRLILPPSASQSDP